MKTLKRKSNSIIIAVRSATVTAMLLVALFTAIFFMGKSYTVMEKTAFGRDVSFLTMPNKDHYVFFGQEYKIPIISVTEQVLNFCRTYAPGIIKLLNYLTTVIKEFGGLIVKLF